MLHKVTCKKKCSIKLQHINTAGLTTNTFNRNYQKHKKNKKMGLKIRPTYKSCRGVRGLGVKVTIKQ